MRLPSPPSVAASRPASAQSSAHANRARLQHRSASRQQQANRQPSYRRAPARRSDAAASVRRRSGSTRPPPPPTPSPACAVTSFNGRPHRPANPFACHPLAKTAQQQHVSGAHTPDRPLGHRSPGACQAARRPAHPAQTARTRAHRLCQAQHRSRPYNQCPDLDGQQRFNWRSRKRKASPPGERSTG